jgi:hypothetical protein
LFWPLVYCRLFQPAGNIFFNGGLKDGAMDYWTDEIPQPSGPALKRHLQLI